MSRSRPPSGAALVTGGLSGNGLLATSELARSGGGRGQIVTLSKTGRMPPNTEWYQEVLQEETSHFNVRGEAADGGALADVLQMCQGGFGDNGAPPGKSRVNAYLVLETMEASLRQLASSEEAINLARVERLEQFALKIGASVQEFRAKVERRRPPDAQQQKAADLLGDKVKAVSSLFASLRRKRAMTEKEVRSHPVEAEREEAQRRIQEDAAEVRRAAGAPPRGPGEVGGDVWLEDQKDSPQIHGISAVYHAEGSAASAGLVGAYGPRAHGAESLHRYTHVMR